MATKLEFESGKEAFSKMKKKPAKNLTDFFFF